MLGYKKGKALGNSFFPDGGSDDDFALAIVFAM